jgi:hypothetical protein
MGRRRIPVVRNGETQDVAVRPLAPDVPNERKKRLITSMRCGAGSFWAITIWICVALNRSLQLSF